MKSVRTFFALEVEKVAFENVGFVEITARRLGFDRRRDASAAAGVRIEHGGEDGCAIKARPSQPINRVGVGDQSSRSTIANDGVILNCAGSAFTPGKHIA